MIKVKERLKSRRDQSEGEIKVRLNSRMDQSQGEIKSMRDQSQ